MTPTEIRRLAAALDAGLSPPQEEPGDDELVRDVLKLARETGAPRARILRVVADAIDTNLALEREATLAVTSARQSGLVLSALPAITVVAAELFGVHALGFLVGGFAGWVCLALGVGASIAGWRWMHALQRRIETPPIATGILGDVLAEILSVTGLRADAHESIRECTRRWGVTAELTRIDGIREAARETGVPVAGLLRADADEVRHTARFAVRESIERLPARMLVPLGVCLFPAFVTLTVIPAVAGMAQGFFRTTS